jgi:hypothetical protein
MSSRLFKMLPLIALIALVALGQMAFAEGPQNHYTVKVVPRHSDSGPQPATAITPNLYGLTAAFTATAYPTTNSDGTDIWPCFGTGESGSSANPDCEFIGDPKIDFPAGGVALGVPSYQWSLANCNATSTSSPDCGETETFYEDQTGDTADDLLYELVATQGSTVLVDTGEIDFTGGGNPYGGLTPPADVVIYGPSNFGGMGLTGPNNGNCLPNINYPVTADPAGAEFIISANKTCGSAVAGPVTITATTEVATPTYTPESTKTCTKEGVSSPCWEVKFTSKYKVSQKWTINLQ